MRVDATANAAPVISLAAFRSARRAAGVLEDLLQAPWLLSVKVEVQPSGMPMLVARVARRDRWVEACIPSHCNDFQVHVRSVTPERA